MLGELRPLPPSEAQRGRSIIRSDDGQSAVGAEDLDRGGRTDPQDLVVPFFLGECDL